MPPPVLPPTLLALLHPDEAAMPLIRPCDAPGLSDTRRQFSDLKLHRIFGCRQFRNPSDLVDAAADASLLQGGERPPTLGDTSTMAKRKKGKSITKFRKYLDKVHLDIVHGDCVSLGGFKYAPRGSG